MQKILGYNYNSSEWFEQSYKNFKPGLYYQKKKELKKILMKKEFILKR